jgi:hypothetical protein
MLIAYNLIRTSPLVDSGVIVPNCFHSCPILVICSAQEVYTTRRGHEWKQFGTITPESTRGEVRRIRLYANNIKGIIYGEQALLANTMY